MIHSQWSSTTSSMRSIEAIFIADVAYVADNPNTFLMLLNALWHTKKAALKQIALNIATIQNLAFRAPIAGASDRIRKAVPAASTSYRKSLEAVR